MTGGTDQELIAAALPLYEVHGELGHGGWGVVLAARHRQLGRDVAIKQLPRAFGADAAVRTRFLTEARTLASLEHPHVVPIYDFVEHEGLCLLVMERLDGGTVLSRAKAGGFTPPTACAVVIAACSALHYAHQRGVLHRDVKPENMMFSNAGALKVTDFGIAKVLGGPATVATRAGDVLGTPAYMAPEQAQGSELSPATDIYAVGTVLYQLLSGRLPFPEDSNPVAMLYRHVHEDPKPLRDVAPDVAAGLAAVIAKALERDPSRRYLDAEQLAAAVGEAAADAWGAGWLPATGMTVVAAGPVLSAAMGQRVHAEPAETILPSDLVEVPSAHEVTPGDLVPVNLLRPDLAATPPPPPPPPPSTPPQASTPPPSAPPQETIDAPRAAPPGTPPGAATPPSPQPAAPPPPAARRRRRPAFVGVAIVVLLALIGVVVYAVSSGGGGKKKAAAKVVLANLEPTAWKGVAPAPSPRQEVASAVTGTTVWILGGLNGPDATNKVEGYDQSNNTWRAGPDLPIVLHHAMAATYKGEVVVAGGWEPQNGNLTAVTSTRVFAMRADNWVELPKLHHARVAGAAAVVDDKLVLFGGQAGGKLVAQTEVYDGKAWSDAPRLPTPRDHLAGASDGTYVYAVGGRQLSADKNVAALERYDPNAKRWTKLADLPTPRGDLGATVVGNKLVAVGGESVTAAFNTVETFDLKTRQWSGAPSLPTPRHGLAVANVHDTAFALVGAQKPSHSVATVVAEGLPFSTPVPKSASPWRPVHDAPTARQELASTTASGVIWVFGGLTGNDATNKVEGYDAAIDTWKTGPDLPIPLNHEMAATYHGELIVMGGFVQQGTNTSAVASNKGFVLRNGAWIELPPMNLPRAAGAAAVAGDRLIVVGGQANGQLVGPSEIFDGNAWTVAPAIPTPRDHLAATSDGRFLYAVGGRFLGADKNVGTFERYDPATGRWAKGPDMPTPRGGLAAAFINGKVVAAGGENPSAVLDTVEAIDIASGVWGALPPLRTGRHGLALAAVGPSLYAIDGGSRPGHPNPTKIAEVLRLTP